ncbi:MAG: Tn3 family transposase, partial [Alphaproteobacteria bacterium]|nr:Tn3 family transposase [Alphaproteobacteria bacterium]
AAGKIRPSQLLRKLASYPRQNDLAVALREVGRIVSAVRVPPFARGREPRCSEPLRASTYDDFRAYA